MNQRMQLVLLYLLHVSFLCSHVEVSYGTMTFQLISGMPCSNLTSGSYVESYDHASVGACAMYCRQNDLCSGFMFQREVNSGRRCHLTSLCQLQRWLRESPPRWPPQAGDCPVRASLSRDRLHRLSSALSPELVNSTVIFADFRDSAVATANYRNVCQTALGALSNVQAAPPEGLKFSGSVSSYVSIDARLFAEAVLTELTIVLTATRSLSDNGVHYFWGSMCDGSSELLVLREYQGHLSLLYQGNNRAVDWWLVPTPTDLYTSAHVTIGVSTNFANTTMYFNGTLAQGTVGSNISIAASLSAETMGCVFLGRTPYNSKRCLNGTLHSFQLLRRAVSSPELLQLVKFGEKTNRSTEDSCRTSGV